jgi:hypothetical protein
MSEPVFDIAFYGIIQPGKDKQSVISNMAALFKTTPEKVRPFFAGGRKVIKSGVDELTAEKYRTALDNVGLVIKIEARKTEEQTSANSSPAAGTGDSDTPISVAPVGADVLENPPAVEPQPIGDISTVTMAEVGADVLENPPVVKPQPIGDISHLTVAEAGADVLENPPVVEPQPIGDISHLTMAEAGADVLENPPAKKNTPPPDASTLSLKDRK